MKDSMVILSRLLRDGLRVFIAVSALVLAMPSEAQTPPPVPSSPISAGRFSTCMRTPVGGVKCWGDNSFGQLGDGTFTNSFTPVDVVGLTSGVAAIAVARSHACALTDSGGVKCWGDNRRGELGDGTIDIAGNAGGPPRNTPVDVAGLGAQGQSIAVGEYFSCAVVARFARCWGANNEGQLGNFSNRNSSVPVFVQVTISKAIFAGSYHACVITIDGRTACWGRNTQGQFGDGTTIGSNFAKPSLVRNAVALALGDFHSCARLDTGGMQCWGDNTSGRLGDGTTTTRLDPVNVFGLNAGVVDIAAGGSHSCARTTDGTMKCWGGNFSGPLGDGTQSNKVVPTQVTGLATGVIGLGAGLAHTCALTANIAQCWGNNPFGQLGNGTVTNSSVPTTVTDSEFAESFPPGGQFPAGWSTTPGRAAGWIVDAGTAGSGLVSLRSAPIGNPQFACTQFTATMGSGDLTFQRRVSSEQNSYFFAVYIDDVGVGSAFGSGDLPWENVAIPVTAGSHTVDFCYSKNASNIAFADGAWIDDVRFPAVLPPLALTGVVSRKMHGTSGLYNLSIDPLIPITDLVTVEPRVIGSGHDIVFQFDGPTTSVGAVTAVDAAANPVGATTAAVSANDVIVTLTGVADNQRVTISITDVNGLGVNASASIGFLVGDVNNTRSVNSSDISGVKARSGQTTNASNFQFDVNASGAINSSDISAVKARSGLVLAP